MGGWEIQGESHMHGDDHKGKMCADRLERYSEMILESMKQAERDRREKEHESGEKTECEESRHESGEKTEFEKSRQLLMKKRRKGFRTRILKPLRRWRGVMKSTVTVVHAPNQ